MHDRGSVIRQWRNEECSRFASAHPESIRQARHAGDHFLYGVPLHWMRDWPSPVPLAVRHAEGAWVTCVDGHRYADFCLADSGAMFGHSPPALVAALAQQLGAGFGCMLPAGELGELGAALEATFGLPVWQLTLSASDANRFVLRWMRGITGRHHTLVFDGCYHGAVDETLVDRQPDGTVVPRASLVGDMPWPGVPARAKLTRVVPFNDPAALEAALADRAVACLLAEPALTNCGLVLPDPDFWPRAVALCRQYGTRLVIDETHTLSTAPGGHARAHGIEPDVWVAGKAVAGGLPCAVYGFTREVAGAMIRVRSESPEGHSGIGTTLSGNLLGVAALRAALTHLHTPATYAAMQAGADRLQDGLQNLLARHGRVWTVTRLGARLELQFMARAPRNAAEVRAVDDGGLGALLHLYLLNRGVLLTPFHGMMLVSAVTTDEQIERLLSGVEAFCRDATVRGL